MSTGSGVRYGITIGASVLVYGGREFPAGWSEVDVYNAMDALTRGAEVHIIQGGARGVDLAAKAWADARGWTSETHDILPDDWKNYGGMAGPMRNAKMIAESLPDVAVRFPGDDGTRDMDRRLKEWNIRVIRVTEKIKPE